MASRRFQATLEAPPRVERLRTFPERPVGSERLLFRVVRQGRGPWWFGSSMEGRFDLPKPHGTCYLASDEIAALLEVIGPGRIGGAVLRDFFTARRLRRLRLPGRRRLADFLARRAAAFGITGEIGSIVPYDLPQRWARRLHRAAFEGVLFRLRHDPRGAEGLALFGPAGERRAWRRGREEVLGEPLLARLREECGLEILERPRASQLRFVEAPRRH